MNDPAILTNRGGILLKLEKKSSIIKTRTLPRLESEFAKTDFKVFGTPVLQYIEEAWLKVRQAKEEASNERRLKHL